MGAPRTFGGLVAAPGRTAPGESAKHYQTPRIVDTPVVMDGNKMVGGVTDGGGIQAKGAHTQTLRNKCVLSTRSGGQRSPAQ